MQRRHIRHGLARDSLGADLLGEDEERQRELDVAEAAVAVHRRLVDKRCPRLGRQHAPLLLVDTHVRIVA